MASTTDPAGSRSIEDLTTAVFGRRMSLDAVLTTLDTVELVADDEGAGDEVAWVGSIGYERFSSNTDFAQALALARVDVLIDVRDLPISRKRGFAKTALSEAVNAVGIEYQHWKPLGNPKEIRDLYKSGQVEEGRKLYEQHLANRAPDLERLDRIIGEGTRVALMCVEHDEDVCHRHSILGALSHARSGQLHVAQVSQP